MKKRKKHTLIILAAMLAICGLTSCMGVDKYTKQQAQDIVAQGRPVLEQFLAGLPAKEIQDETFGMSLAAEEGSLIWKGPYPSNSVTVTFKADGKNCEAILDLETSVIYSDYYMFDLNEHIARQLKPYCEKYGFTGKYHVSNATVYYQFYSHDVAVNGKTDNRTNSYVSIENMIPTTFNQIDENARADAYLKNAPISDFKIYYDMQDDEPLDPRILSDYLSESGNFDAVEDGLKPTISSYELIGKKVFSDFPKSGVAGWHTFLSYNGDIQNMWYSLVRTDFHKVDDFCFTYTAAEKSGEIAEYAKGTWEEHAFPIEIGEGKLKYFGDDAYGDVTLRFEQKPKYTFTRIRYNNGVARDPEKLIAVQNEDGMWYLTLEDRERAYLYSYLFDQEQDLEFEKNLH